LLFDKILLVITEIVQYMNTRLHVCMLVSLNAYSRTRRNCAAQDVTSFHTLLKHVEG